VSDGPAPPVDPLIGASFGNYRVVAELGRGGMGAVYVAEHTLIGKKAAIKVLLPRFSTDKDIVQRFFNEAKSAALIQHPGIVEIFDFGVHDGGSAYLVMELLGGESLTARLKREGKLALPLIVAVARQVAAALGAAHDKQIVHRDLKPDNVYLLPDDEMPHGLRVKVLDFGIAKLADEGQVDEVKTQAGQMLGTPYYMSPEQCKGAGEVDHRTDVYALGCMLYQMAVGTVPFDEKGTGALIAAHIYESPPPPRTFDAEIAPALEDLLLKALEKDPGRRQQSMDELIAELEACLAAPGGAAAAPRSDAARAEVKAELAAYAPRTAGGGSAESAAGRASAASDAGGASAESAAGGGSAESAAGGGSAARAPTDAAAPPHTRIDRTAAPSVVTGAPGGPPRRTLLIVAAGALVVGGVTATVEMTRSGRGKPQSALAGAGGTTDAAPPPDARPLPPTSCDQGDFADCAVQAARAERGDGVPRDLARAQALFRKACDGGAHAGCAAAGQRLLAAAASPADALLAFSLWKKGCDGGDAPACVLVGLAYEAGVGVERDASRAFALFLAECDKQRPDACAHLAGLYRRGRGVAVDLARAGALALRACDAGSAAGCALLGELYRHGQGVALDTERGAAAFRKGCELGGARACVEAGELERARTLAAGACALGDAEGCAALAAADTTTGAASTRFVPACRLGDLDACTAAAADPADPKSGALLEDTCAAQVPGACVALGHRLVNDQPERALAVWEDACGRGGDHGCLELGDATALGLGGLDKDEPRASLAYRKGCDGGDGRACTKLAERLAAGLGLRKDERKARATAERACSLVAAECGLAAGFAALGQGGAADLERATSLYTRACGGGDRRACVLKDDPLAATRPDAGAPGTDGPSTDAAP
jgi:serine/threonine-protein kinase